MKKILIALLSCVVCNTVSADLWQDTSVAELLKFRENNPVQAQENQIPRFDEARLLSLDEVGLNTQLNSAFLEDAPNAPRSPTQIRLPLPYGEFGEYFLYLSPVMSAGLAAKYPEIRTFKVVDINNAANTGRLDFTPQGFHGVLTHDHKTVFIDPLGNDNYYQSYFKHDFTVKKVSSAGYKPFVCNSNEHTEEQPLVSLLTENQPEVIRARAARLSFGGQIKTYRLAIAATSSFTRFHGGTKAKGLAALVTSINRINAVYERDLAVMFEIIDDNDKLVYTDSANDPFDGSVDLAGQAVVVINQEIGAGNYDIGHVVSGDGVGGRANLGVICNDKGKAGGETSSDSPINDPFFIDYVAHELGHQFGARHSFNASSDACGGGNRSSNHAYEPGSGSTIMGYAGICSPENLQQGSDAYFHSDSIKQIRSYLDGNFGAVCGVAAGRNTLPTVEAGADKVIPKQTPFMLSGLGSDADGDTLTYTWEQIDLGLASNGREGLVDNGKSPIFRSFMGTTSPERIFPQLSDILNNTTTYGEVMPTTNRDLNFRLTVKDSNGGVSSDTLKLQVSAAAGPFKVTLPANINWVEGSQLVSWNVANTTAAPVSCANVEIDLSTDGGTSFPHVLLASTANDGSAMVNVPAVLTSNGRVRVRCTNQPFFAINNAPITIVSDGRGNGNNNAPTAISDQFTLRQSGNTHTLDVLRNDSDVDGDTLVITKINDIDNHAISISSDGKSINLKHRDGFNGRINFVYTVSDGTTQARANVDVTIIAPAVLEMSNQPPVANRDTYEVKQNSGGTTLMVLDNDTDADGDELTIISINNMSNSGIGTISGGQSIIYKPATGFVGSEVIKYTIRDVKGATATADVNVTVKAESVSSISSSGSSGGGGGSNSPYFLLGLLVLAIWRIFGTNQPAQRLVSVTREPKR